MSSAAYSAPSDYQTDCAGLSSSDGALKVSSPFRILDNITPAQNEEICVLNGFPKLSDIFDTSVFKPVRAESKPDSNSENRVEASLLSARDAFENFVKNVVLNFDEQKVLSMFNGIVRQVADYALNPHDISNSIQRLLKSAKEPIDFSKIAAVLNHRLQNSELHYASVALQISNDQEFFTVMSRGETVLKTPVSSRS
ncbi:MAG: hypothetical protein SFY67_01170 [Candidatus Melainabacteria bacterium]|nr:hypothetical protein [Candidatus Melainabacteria bacterium]